MDAILYTGTSLRSGFLKLLLPVENPKLHIDAITALGTVKWNLCSRQTMWEANPAIKTISFEKTPMSFLPWTHGKVIKFQRDIRKVLTPLGIQLSVHTGSGLDE